MFSFTQDPESRFQDTKTNELNNESSLSGTLKALLKYLIEKLFKPCRVDGMRFYQDFED